MQGFDKFGNPEGKQYELGAVDDHLLSGERILLYVSCLADAERNYDWHQAQNAVANRNIQMDIVLSPKGGDCTITREQLEKYTQLWYVSDRVNHLSDQQVNWVEQFVNDGNGLLIWADNEPSYADANVLTKQLIGTHFSGDKAASGILELGESLVPGVFIEHPLTQGINRLFEGITISTIAEARNLTILAQSHDGQMCMACYEDGNKRIVLDSAFTKLSPGSFKKTAGTARYFRNIAFWLTRRGRKYVYKTFTPGRESLATINHGQDSDRYKHTVTESTNLTWVLHWEGKAKLGLSVEDPSGRVIIDQSADKAPLRVSVMADKPGDYITWVTGLNVPKADFPFVLNIVIQKAPTLTRLPSPVQNKLPIYMIVGITPETHDLKYLLDSTADHFVSNMRRYSSGQVVPSVAVARLSNLQTELDQTISGLLTTVEQGLAQSEPSKPLIVLLLSTGEFQVQLKGASRMRELSVNKQVNVIAITLDATKGSLGLLSKTPVLGLDEMSSHNIERVVSWLTLLAEQMCVALEKTPEMSAMQAPPLPDCLRILSED